MFRIAVFAVLASFLAGQTPLHSQTRYVIRLTKAGQGAVVRVEKKDSQRKHIQVVDLAGKTLQDREDKQAESVIYQEKIVTKPDGQERATHLQRQFERAERRVGDRILPIPLQGKTYDIEKKDGRYRFQYLGGEAIPAEAAQALEREFNSGLNEELDWEKLVLPANAVRVNDSWDLDMERVIQVVGKLIHMAIDPGHSSARAMLSRIESQDNHHFAELDAVFDLATKAVINGKNSRPLQPGSRIVLRLKINGCIDGSTENCAVDVQLQMLTSALMTGPNHSTITMKVEFESTINEVRRELPRR